MAHRSFRDARDRVWEVWEVQPSSFERRQPDRTDAAAPQVERRHRTEHRIVPRPLLAKGWLVFASRDEKRRLAPIPAGWSERTEEELAELLAAATPSGRPRRLIE